MATYRVHGGYFGCWRISYLSIVGIGMGFFSGSRIPKAWARSKNPENPGDRDRDLKTSKNSEKIPSAKSRKSRNSRDRDRNLKPPGFGIFYLQDVPGIFIDFARSTRMGQIDINLGSP